MTQFIILSSAEVLRLQKNEPVIIQIDLRPYTLISEYGFNRINDVKVEIMPSVQPEQRGRGKWVKSSLKCDGAEDFWECSECGWEIYHHKAKTNYCPSCGARMEEEA